MQGYYTWLGVYDCSMINLSLSLSSIFYTLILVMHMLLYLSPHSASSLYDLPPRPSSPRLFFSHHHVRISSPSCFSASRLSRSFLAAAGSLWKEVFSMHLLDLLQLLSWYFLPSSSVRLCSFCLQSLCTDLDVDLRLTSYLSYRWFYYIIYRHI